MGRITDIISRRRAAHPMKPITQAKVKSLINRDIEIKRGGTASSFNAISFAQTGVVTPLASVALGNAQGQRLGARIRIRAVRMLASIQGNGTDNAAVARVIVLRDNQNNGLNTVSNTDLFNDTTAADSPNWLYNINNAKRFTIVYDKMFSLNAQIATQLIKTTFSFRKAYKNGILVQYSNTTAGTNADIVSGAYYLLTFCNNSVNVPTMGFNFNIDYEDA